MPRSLGAIVCLGLRWQSMRRIGWDKLFIPCDDAQNNNYGEDRYRNQLALYIHVLQQGVEFFHNLNFCFQKWFRSGFQRAEIKRSRRVRDQKEYGVKNRAVLLLLLNIVLAFIIVLLRRIFL